MVKYYTDAQKIAYYKAKALAATKARAGKKSGGRRSYDPGVTRSAGPGGSRRDFSLEWEDVPWLGSGRLNYKPSSRSVAPMSRTTAPSAISTMVKTSTPAIKAESISHFVIENRELLSNAIFDVTSGEFQVIQYSINPGLADIMPYAANIAKSYTRYKMEFCLEYAPSVSSSTPGTIALAYDRNSQAAPPTSIQDLMSYEGSTVGSVWAATNFPANSTRVSPSEKKLYTRYGALTSGEDINLYDMCKVFVCANGLFITPIPLSGTQSIGNVYINYKITFMNQKLSFVSNSNILSYNERFTPTSFDPLGVNPGISDADMFNYQYQYGQGNVQFIPASETALGKAMLIFPNQGTYMLSFNGYAVTQSGTLSGTVAGGGGAFVLINTIGTDIILSSSTPDQNAVIVPSPGTLAYCNNTYVIEVLSSDPILGLVSSRRERISLRRSYHDQYCS